jgi:hypothetical protein
MNTHKAHKAAKNTELQRPLVSLLILTIATLVITGCTGPLEGTLETVPNKVVRLIDIRGEQQTLTGGRFRLQRWSHRDDLIQMRLTDGADNQFTLFLNGRGLPRLTSDQAQQVFIEPQRVLEGLGYRGMIQEEVLDRTAEERLFVCYGPGRCTSNDGSGEMRFSLRCPGLQKKRVTTKTSRYHLDGELVMYSSGAPRQRTLETVGRMQGSTEPRSYEVDTQTIDRCHVI